MSYQLFHSKYFGLLVLGLIIGISFLLMFIASSGESVTLDEVAHIPAGYSYVKYFDYRLNHEHPPLVKVLSALPLLFQKINFPLENQFWQEGLSNQWSFGGIFFHESDNDAQKIVEWARLAPMILTILLVIVIYIWSKELIGRWWALLPAFLLALSPNFLAHGHYVTTDVGASLGIFVALYFFVKFLVSQSNKYLIFSGLAFGVAQLTKFSALILVPVFVCLLVIRALFVGHWFNLLGKLFLIFLIGFSLIYAAYFLFTFNYPFDKQLLYTQTALGFFNKTGRANSENCLGVSYQKDIKLWAACSLKEGIFKTSVNRLTRPLVEYSMGALGVFRQSRLQHEPTYLNGEVRDSGRWYYFPEIFFLKEPLPSLVMIFIAFIFSLWGIAKNFKIDLAIFFKKLLIFLENYFTEFAMLFFIIIYGVYSITSGMNVGIRHIFPIIPFVYILTAVGLRKIRFSLKKEMIFVLSAFYLIEVFSTSPYFLSYFNQLGGGVSGGYNYAVHSNYDWGQDLKRLGDWVKKNNVKKISVSYYGATTGGFNYYIGDGVEDWGAFTDSPKLRGIDWFAVSVHLLKTRPERYFWLKAIKDIDHPDDKAGTSIFIYRL